MGRPKQNPANVKSRLEAPSLSVIVPALNEQEAIRTLIAKVSDELGRIEVDYEILVVDDGSTDATWQEVLEASERRPQVRGIKLSRNFGKEHAICAGLSAASGAAAIVMDADLQHPPMLILDMVAKWQEGYLIVDAVKTQRGRETWAGRVIAGTFYKVFNWLSGFDLTGHSDFKLLDRKVIDEWKRLDERNLFFRGMTSWLGFNRAVVEFEVSDRAIGKTRWTYFNLIDLAVSALTSFSSIPLRLVTGIGLIFLLVAFVIGVQTFYMWVSGSALVGFTTVILLVLFSSSVLMIALGIIGEYLARIYKEVKARPRFVVEEYCGFHRPASNLPVQGPVS